MKKEKRNQGFVPEAWVVSSYDRGRKSIKKRKTYLKDGETFEIEMFNPLQSCVLAKIKLNGEFISKSGLVLKPGQRFYLDCFIDDNKKFIFNTYDVDNEESSLKAIKKNGLLEVYFYNEIKIKQYSNLVDIQRLYYVNQNQQPYYSNNNYYINQTQPYYSNYGDFTTSSSTGEITFSTNSIKSSIETGRIEKGESSKQKFDSIDMDFENNYISFTSIQILPDSIKPIEVKDLKKNKKPMDLLNLIEKLSDLKKEGIISDDEFLEKKKDLLSRI